MIEQKNIEQVLQETGFVISSFRGTSMNPMLKQETDRVLIVPPTFPMKLYEVPLYRRGNVYVLHRIIAVAETGEYVIRGDNCIEKEYGIQDDAIVCVLSGFWRGKEFVSCTEELNRRYAVKARRTLLWRKAKGIIRRILP